MAKSLFGSALQRLALAKKAVEEIVGDQSLPVQTRAVTVYMQIGDKEPIELGHLDATRQTSEKEIRQSLYQLFIGIAKRWESADG